MDNTNISEKLKALAQGKNRSNTAKLREIFSQIEEALNAGALRTDVYQALKESGFSFSFASFELAIYRIRKEMKKQNMSVPATTRTLLHRAVSVPALGTNPLRVLSGKPKEGEHSPIPLAKFEVDNT